MTVHNSPEDIWYPTLPSLATRTPSLRSQFAATSSFVIDRRLVRSESNIELYVGMALSTRPDVETIVEQPPRVPYIDRGVQYHHTFDFRLDRIPPRRTAVAVKWSDRIESSGIRRIVRLIAEQCGTDFADDICIITEKDLSRNDRHNVELIHESMMVPNAMDDAIVREAAAEFQGAVTIADLVGLTGLRGAGFRAVARLIGGRILRLVDDRIDSDARVRRA
jgi:hypothetical protein